MIFDKTKFKSFLNRLGSFIDDYLDTIALIFLAVGSLLVGVALGTLPDGGYTGIYNFAYLKHPITLDVGLLAIVVGFVIQLADNLINDHRLEKTKVAWIIFFVVIILILLIFNS